MCFPRHTKPPRLQVLNSEAEPKQGAQRPMELKGILPSQGGHFVWAHRWVCDRSHITAKTSEEAIGIVI